jgi:hypothetical protein
MVFRRLSSMSARAFGSRIVSRRRSTCRLRVSRRVFQILLPEAPTPERCLEAYHLHRTRLELIAERKVRRRRLTDDGNIEITGRDLRDRENRSDSPHAFRYRRAAS